PLRAAGWWTDESRWLVQQETGYNRPQGAGRAVHHQTRFADQGSVRNRGQGLRLYSVASAGAGLGRVEKTEGGAARRQFGSSLLDDQTRIRWFQYASPGGFVLPGLFVSGRQRRPPHQTRSERIRCSISIFVGLSRRSAS